MKFSVLSYKLALMFRTTLQVFQVSYAESWPVFEGSAARGNQIILFQMYQVGL